MNVCTKCHSNPSNSWDLSVWNEVVDWNWLTDWVLQIIVPHGAHLQKHSVGPSNTAFISAISQCMWYSAVFPKIPLSTISSVPLSAFFILYCVLKVDYEVGKVRNFLRLQTLRACQSSSWLCGHYLVLISFNANFCGKTLYYISTVLHILLCLVLC